MQNEKLVKDDEYKLLLDIKDYLSRNEINTISSPHIKLLCKLW